jgi:hypothetical protein
VVLHPSALGATEQRGRRRDRLKAPQEDLAFQLGQLTGVTVVTTVTAHNRKRFADFRRANAQGVPTSDPR